MKFGRLSSPSVSPPSGLPPINFSTSVEKSLALSAPAEGARVVQDILLPMNHNLPTTSLASRAGKPSLMKRSFTQFIPFLSAVFLTLGLSGGLSAQCQTGEFVTNGTFDSDLSGFTVANNGNTGPGGFENFSQSNGSAVYFGEGANAEATLTQTLMDLVPGETYNVSVDLAGSTTQPNEITAELRVDGNVLISQTATQIAAQAGSTGSFPNTFTNYTTSFVATGSTADLVLAGVTTAINGRDIAFDNVSIMGAVLADADGDGVPCNMDADENDPCVPDMNSGPCQVLNADFDGDGVTDMEENMPASCGSTVASNVDEDNSNGTDPNTVYLINWAGTAFADGLDNGDVATFNLPDGTELTVTASNAAVSGTVTGEDNPGIAGRPTGVVYNSTGGSEAIRYLFQNIASASFTLTFDYSYNGESLPLDLLFADGESTLNGSGSSVAAVTNGDDWTVMAQDGTPMFTTAGNTATITGSSSGGVFFRTDNATSLDVTIRNGTAGQDGQAAAFGIILLCDTNNNGIPDQFDPCAPGGGTGDPSNPIFANADCDQDGEPNGTDSSPEDPCAPDVDALACPTGDTDGDGDDNSTECPAGYMDNDGDGIIALFDDDDTNATIGDMDMMPNTGICTTDPTVNDNVDNDGDGQNDDIDPDDNDPCVVADGTNPVGDPNNPIFANADCDGDGLRNAEDPDSFDPCSPNVNSAACPTGDADGDGVPNSQECGGAFDDMDGDGVLAQVDDDDNDPAIRNDDNALQPEFDVNGNGIIDCEDSCFPNFDRNNPECDGIDPAGFIFCTSTGEIVSGGTVTITADDPDNEDAIIVTSDGSDGAFQFFSGPGTTFPVTYTITYTPPAGSDFMIDPDVADMGTFTAPMDGDGAAFVGSDDANNDGFVDDVSDGANPFFTSVTFAAASDEDVFLLNIPLIGCMAPIEIDAQASCEDADGNLAPPNSYFVRVDTLIAETEGPFTVTVNGVDQTYTPGAGDTLFFGPFTNSGTGNAVQVVRAVDDTDDGVAGLAEAVEVLCNVRPDGGQMSGGFCMTTTDDEENTGAILAQSAPGSFMAGGTSGQVQTYALVDSDSIIVQTNGTGLFMNLPSDTFMVFAINYRDGEPLPDFLIPGQSIRPIIDGVDSDDTNSPLDGACYTVCNTDPIIMVPVNCLSIGSTVFTDNDDDATFEPADGEEGISDVTVNLFTESDPVGAPGVFDSLVLTTMTDDMGNYFFGGLDDGNYVVSIPTTPDGFPLSSTNATAPEDVATGDNMDSGIQAMPGDSVVSPVIMLMAQMEPEGADEFGLGGMQDDNVVNDAGTVTSDDDANGDMTVDFGFFPGLSLGSTVFADLNNNALQDMGEMGIPGVDVTLYTESDPIGAPGVFDSIVSTQPTGPMGDYLFDMLAPGNYIVGVSPSDEFPISSSGGEPDADGPGGIGVDGDDNGEFSDLMGGTMVEPGMDVFSGIVMLSGGDEPTFADGETAQGAEQDGVDGSASDANGNMTVDFGFFPGLSIGSTVFNDLDNDGIYEPGDGETAIPGVQVALIDGMGMPLDTVPTDADGNYFFGGLTAGDYTVAIIAENFVMGGPLGEINTSSTPTEEGDEDIDNNDNGIQPEDAGTMSTAGQPTTSGTITLSLGDEPTNGAGANGENGAGANQDDMMDDNGNMTVDFGFFTPVSIGSQVFADLDNSGDDNMGAEMGINGVTVNLYDDVDGSGDFSPGDTLVATTTTMTVDGDDGIYFFDDLSPGDYIVGVVPPADNSLSSNGPGESTDDDQTDGNDNGVQDMPGDEIYSNAINLTPGTEPEGEDGAGGDQDGMAGDPTDNDGDMTVDFGLVPSVSVGSVVFADLDNDGMQGATEMGVEGIIINLLDENGMVVAMDTTDADGTYFFGDLFPGMYQLEIAMVPDSLPLSSTNPVTSGDEMTDGDDDGNQVGGPGTTITTDFFDLQPNAFGGLTEDGPGGDQDDANEDDGNMTIDIGLVPNYSLGSTVFADLDNNAVQDMGEMGVAGVPVTLYMDTDGDMMFDPAVDMIVATDVTDGDGNYFFDGLLPGDYFVGIEPTDELPFSSNDDEDADDPNADEDDDDDNGTQLGGGGSPIVSGLVTLGTDGMAEPTGAAEGNQGGMQDDGSATDDAAGNMTVDFGLFPGVSLGSTVFVDENNDGVQMGDDEVGISGATVILYGANSMGVIDSVYRTVTTDDDGNYLFEGLPEGDYIVAVVPTEEFPVSSSMGEEADPDANMDGNDNGVFTGLGEMGMGMLMSGDTVFSGIVTLEGGEEPVDGGMETGDGNEQDGMAGSPQDANGNMTVDFGFTGGVSIGSTVFFDNDNDGIFEPSDMEEGIAGVEVFLYAADGVTVLDSTTTDDNGNYFFGGLDDGTYQVGIPASSFAMGEVLESAPNSSTVDFVGEDQPDNTDDGMQPGGAGTQVLSGPIDLALNMEPVDGAGAGAENGQGAGQDNPNDNDGNMTVDFGFFPTLSIGSQVFQDIDNSGTFDEGTEMGIEDVTVLLFADVDGNNIYTPGVDTLIDSTMTDDMGLYEFDTLAPGNYIVAVVPPVDNNLSSNGPGESTADDGVDNNDNGIQGMAGDTIFSTAIELMVGDEPVGEMGPGGDQDSPDDQDDDGDMTIDFGLLPSVSVGSTVFQDTDNSGTQEAGEEGVEGIIVTLLDDDGMVVARDTTDENGNYFFDGLTPGDYELVINMVPDSLPNSSSPIDGNEGNFTDDLNDNGIQDGGPGAPISSGIFTLTPNGEPVEPTTGVDDEGAMQDDDNDNDGNMTIDFGLVPNYSIGSTVFADLDDSGIQEAGEEGVPNVPVTLYVDVDGDGIVTAADSIVTTVDTDDDGNYFFDNLLPNTYIVGITPTDELPFSSTGADAGEAIDGNDNGEQPGMMAGDSIFSGPIVLGTDGNDEPVDGAEDGQGGDQDDDSALEDASGNMTIDFGLFPGVSLGSTVFADLNNSGSQDDDEDGISGVTVLLYSDEGMDGFTPGVDTLVTTTVTDGNGDYFFDGLDQGSYVVAVVPSDDFPVSSTGADQETDPNADMDGNDNGINNSMGMMPVAFDTIFSGSVELTAGAEPVGGDGTGAMTENAQGSDQDGDDGSATDANGNMTVDFGFFPGLSVGSTVFFDNDNDGLFEPSDNETGIAGVEVVLYADTDGDGMFTEGVDMAIDSVRTDDNGNYIFENLDAGNYFVGIPESSFAVGEPLEGAPNSSTPTDGEADDQVDNNDNGIQDGGAGTLTISSLIELTIDGEPTNDGGPNGMESGNGSTQDDVNDANGDMTIDFGFFPTLSIGSQVFQDIDNSGTLDDGEMGIENVTVLLFADVDGDNMYTPGVDTLVDSTMTDGMGLYEFDTLAPGNYIVAVVPPVDNNLSSNGPGESTADDGVDNNDNGIQGMAGDTIFSTAIELMVGDEPVGEAGPGGDQDDDDDQDDDGDMTIDFGLLPSVSVGSTVFQDTDNSGTQEAGEEGVEGIIVTLLDNEGMVIATDTTDENGNYFFDGLTPGDYELVINMVPDSLPNSSSPMDGNEGNFTDDLNDNGIQDGGPGAPITSGIFTLTPNGEPVEPLTGVDDTGAMQDDDNDDDGNMTIDFGLVPNYSIGSTVFADLNNNAVQDDDEDGVAGVPVTLYVDLDGDGVITAADSTVATVDTDDDGNYFFGNLLPGDYIVGIVPTDELPFSSSEADDENDPNMDVDGNDNGIQGVNDMQGMAGDSIFSGIVTLGNEEGEPAGDLEEGEQGGDQDDDSTLEDLSGNMTVDFGLFPGVSLGSTVFADVDADGMQDDDEDGISDLTVLLYSDSDGDGVYTPGVDTLVAMTETDDDGNYFFDMLPEGDYFVGVVPGDEFPLSSTDGEEADPNADVDNNDNGIMNPQGMTPMAGDTVLSGLVMLTGGDEPEGDDEDAQGGDQDDENDSSGNMTVDFAFNPGLSIGSTVFFDLDNDGLLEDSDGEQGIPGVLLQLFADTDGDGMFTEGVDMLVDTTRTGSDGNYLFSGLDEGDYIVVIPQSSFVPGQPLESAPNSSTPTFGEADDQVDNNDNGIQEGGAGTIVTSSVITLTINGEPTADGTNGTELGQGAEQDDANDANGDMTVDFGFFPTMSIGSQVFYDIDNSGDNNNGDDPGIDGVTVLLYDDTDGNNIYTPGVDTLVATTVTMDGGLYEFDTLVPGDYIVAVVPPDTANLSSNGPAEDIDDDQADGNDNGSQLMAGDTIYSTAINLSVGDEPENEPFAGGDQDNDDDQDDDGDMTIDFGLLPSVSVGSTVFVDLNNDGIQDGMGEDGVPGIIVDLLDPLGNVVATDTTDADGNYFFDGLTPGDYELVINELPDSLPTSSTVDMANGENGDSDDNGIQVDGPGTQISTGVFTLTPNAYGDVVEDGQGGDQDGMMGDAGDDDGNMTFDFGLVPSYSIGSTVFADLDNNAVQDAGEDGISQVPVTLYSDIDMDGFTPGVDTIVASTLTDANGNYFFDGLLPGSYVVGIEPTDDLPLSSNEDLDEDVDAMGGQNSDVDGNDNGTQVDGAGSPIFSGSINLGNDGMAEPTGDDEDAQGGDQDDASTLSDATGNMTVDFGLFPGVSLGSTVFFDDNANGVQDLNENGIAGVQVVLFDAVTMLPLDTVSTDATGSYFFGGLQEGDYFVQIPVSNFDMGNALEEANFSSEITDTEDNQVDGNDNGIQEDGAGGVVTSPVITLMIGDEPEGDDESSPGGAQDDAFDANGDMTVDFGFVLPQFDLALIKEIGDDQSPNVNPGDTVTFTITVFNQGNIAADNIEITDSIPDGLSFPADINPDWALGADSKATTTLMTFNGLDSLAPNGSVMVDILLTVDAPLAAGEITNFAEISDDANAFGQEVDDIDSTPDDNLSNDEFEQDNGIDGDGLGGEDEDDHDPATININVFDLALTKTLNAAQERNAAPGDTILFDINVFNQGDIAADNVAVVDFIPNGLNFNGTLPENAGWTLDGNGNAVRTLSVAGGELTQPLQPDSSATVTIALVLDAPLPAGTIIRNIAEIQSATDSLDNPQVDNDSDFDDGDGVPDDIADEDDNEVDGTGVNGSDEDESDFADIGVNAFDLALRKNLSPGQSREIDPGEDVRFDIVIINQGEVAADNIVIRDFLPTNFIISPNETEFVDGGTAMPSAVGTFSVANGGLPVGGIQPGEQDTFEITLVLAMADGGQLTYRNVAEIEDATDLAGNEVEDIDSEYADPNNPDTVEDIDDGVITENGLLADQDEDESDFEAVITRRFDLALTKIRDGEGLVSPGDTVSFTIRVINQGTIGADSVVISDYMPIDGFIFDETLNPEWTATSQLPGTDTLRLQTVLQDFDGQPTLLPNESVEVSIQLVVVPTMSTNATITNTAEISDATGPLGQMVIDVDSPMDTIPDNDEFTSDNNIDGNGLAGGDEDNSDPATVTVGGFDLALTKQLATGQSTSVDPGDTITYDLIIVNQGDIAADNIPIVDFIPDGLTLDMSFGNWMVVGGGDGFTSVSDTFTVADGELPAGGLLPGMSDTVQIRLVLDAPFTGGATLRNVAELGMATDEEGNPQDDNDSEPADPNDPDFIDDADNDNIDGDGMAGGDEDESDFAVIMVNTFDLALTKELAPGQSMSVEAGDTVDFVIRVINQGTVPADNVRVSDYLPSGPNGFTFDPTLNPGWDVYATIGDTTYIDITVTDFDGGAAALAPGAFVDVPVSLVVNPAMDATAALTNLAEISDATDDFGNEVTDVDSPMDTIPGNDNFFEDNETDGNGLAGGDEDNSDPATIFVGGFDLALIKTLAPGQTRTVSPGDDVVFNVTIINQGAITADNVNVVDYIPAGLLFEAANNPGWTFNDDGTASTVLSVANGELSGDGLEPGQRATVQLILTVAPPMFPDYASDSDNLPDMDGVESGEVLTNEAEIVSATNEDGVVQVDIDSNGDNVQGNDGDIEDDEENGTGADDGDDEDDSDIAIVTVECYQDPGFDNTVQVCLGCDDAVVTINLFESLGGLPNIGGTFTEGDLVFMDEDGNAVAVDITDPTNVVIPGTVDRSRDYTIDYTIPASNGCAAETATIIIDIFDIQNLSCTGFQNISLGEDCEAEITPSLILQGDLFCASSLEVVLLSTSGDTLRDALGNPTATVGSDQVNQTLYVSLVDPQCDNSCWGQILVEDKQRPTIECPADISGLNGIDFICTDLDSIVNLESSFAFTGAPVIADNCTPTDELQLEFFDLVLPNDDPMCTESTILRTFTVTDESGNQNSCVQRITVRPATLADVTIPTQDFFTVNCDENTQTLPNGNPLPTLSNAPFVTTALGTYPIEASDTYCSLAVQFEDGQRVDGCEGSFEFGRTFRIFDWCTLEDGSQPDPIVYTQIIRVGDFQAPEFTTSLADGTVYEANTPNCAAIIRLDDVGIRILDNCSQNITTTAVIFPEGDSTAPIGTFFLNFDNGEAELSTEIPLGTHVIRYTYEDGCGNIGFTDVNFSVIDGDGPVVVCENGLNIGLSMNSAGGAGTAVLTPMQTIVEAYDACGEITSMEIGLLGADGDETAVEYDDFVLLTCEDLGMVAVSVRVEDESGNVNYCTTDVLVEFKAGSEPTCQAPSEVTLTCAEFSAALVSDITESTIDERNQAFGFATGIGMCDVTVEDAVFPALNSCGVGTITRTFTVTSSAGGQSVTNTQLCAQTITVIGTYDYQVILPGDMTVNCTEDIDTDSVQVIGGACDMVIIDVTEETVENTAGPECRQLQITYDITNVCEYDPVAGGTTIIPRDGIGSRANTEAPLYFNVLAGNDRTLDDDVAFFSTSDDRIFTESDGDVAFAGYTTTATRGRFSYTQIVNIIDRNSPVVIVPEFDACIAAGGNACTADVTFTFTATDQCDDVTNTYEVDANFDGTFVADDADALGIVITDVAGNNGSFDFTAVNVPAGNHALRITSSDVCGNSTVSVVEFCVDSDLTPTPLCRQTIVAPLTLDGAGNVLAEVWASDFIASDLLDCSGNVIEAFSIYTEAEIADGMMVAEGRIGIEVTCADRDLLPVRVYAFSDGNASDFCQVIVEVQDPSELCGDDNTGNIAGVIMTEMMEPVENTVIDLTSSADMSMTYTTDAEGDFLFNALDFGDDYTITPTHFTDYLNGVRTSDIVAITRHILGVDGLDSPYNLIAADVDGNTEINVGDIINIRRLILGLSDTYPNGMPSWSFVPANHDFADMSNPWAAAFPAVLNFNNLASNMVDADFIGIKLGDVNNSARANSEAPARPRTLRGSLELEADEINLQQGETYRVPVTAPDLTAVDGYQFTFEFDRTALEVIDIEPGLVTAGNFGMRFVDQGLITTSWNWQGANVPAEWTGEEVLFTLVLKAEATGRLSDAIEAGSRYTEAEAYQRGSGELSNVDLVFNEDVLEVAGYRLHQNIPNPVMRETTIGFELPQAHEEVTIAITDAAGRLVRTYNVEGIVGYNSIRITKRHLNGASGVYSYTVVAGDWVATKRMVVVE